MSAKVATDGPMAVKEGLVKKKTVKDGKDKGWKQRYVILTLDSLQYYDKKKKSPFLPPRSLLLELSHPL